MKIKRRIKVTRSLKIMKSSRKTKMENGKLIMMR